MERAYDYDECLSALVRLAKLPQNETQAEEVRAVLESEYRKAVAIGKSNRIHALKDALADIPTPEEMTAKLL